MNRPLIALAKSYNDARYATIGIVTTDNRVDAAINLVAKAVSRSVIWAKMTE